MICRGCKKERKTEEFYLVRKGGEERNKFCRYCVLQYRQERKAAGLKAKDPFLRWKMVMEVLRKIAVNQQAGLLPMGRQSRMQNPWPREV